MSVIVSRALPDVPTVFKPVHRRILYGMTELGIDWNKKYVKCARVTGDRDAVNTIPRQHGDLRCARTHGAGLVSAAAADKTARATSAPSTAIRRRQSRYTECRLQKAAAFAAGRSRQGHGRFPRQLRRHPARARRRPAKFPNLLVNGAGGIAVGMATISTHNLVEVIDGLYRLIDNPAIGTAGTDADHSGAGFSGPGR